jgi:8-oxo-dGTP pyrophosphatase MutT (NUDIX family)
MAIRTTPVIDPRQVPVVKVDAHLPSVDAQVLSAAAMRQRFLCPPVWQAERLVEKRWDDRDPIAAAVLIPIVMRASPTVLLTQRTAHLPTHAGQIAFPGGKVDRDDRDAHAAALREAQEEVGLDARWVEVIGELPVYATGSAFMVTPVVALVQPAYTLALNPSEVADAFEVPLPFLMNPAHHRHHEALVAGQARHFLSMPYQDANTERYIWGATAAMLRNLYCFLAAPWGQPL